PPHPHPSTILHSFPTRRSSDLHFIKNWLTVRRKDTMTKSTKLGGTFKLVGTSTNLYRMGYGTMQLAGPEVWGPPRDVAWCRSPLDRKSTRLNSSHVAISYVVFC